MAGLSGRRTMVAVRPPFCPKLPNLGSTGWDFVPMESPSPGLKSQPLSIPAKLWPKEARTPNIFRNNVKIRRFYKYRNIRIKSEGSGPGNENGIRLVKMIIYPHHAKAPPIRSKNDH